MTSERTFWLEFRASLLRRMMSYRLARRRARRRAKAAAKAKANVVKRWAALLWDTLKAAEPIRVTCSAVACVNAALLPTPTTPWRTGLASFDGRQEELKDRLPRSQGLLVWHIPGTPPCRFGEASVVASVVLYCRAHEWEAIYHQQVDGGFVGPCWACEVRRDPVLKARPRGRP